MLVNIAEKTMLVTPCRKKKKIPLFYSLICNNIRFHFKIRVPHFLSWASLISAQVTNLSGGEDWSRMGQSGKLDPCV